VSDSVVIDCHMHVCPKVGGTDDRLPYQGGVYGKARGAQGVVQLLPPCFERTDSPPELALAHMDGVGVDRAFLVQGPMYGFHNRYVAGAVARWPDRFLGFCLVDPSRGQEAAEELADCRERGLRGLKIEWPAAEGMAPGISLVGDAEWRVWQRAAEREMILYLHLHRGAEQVEHVRRIVGDLGLKVIIAHLGGAPSDGWEEQVRLANEEKVWIGCSALPQATREDFPAPKAQELLRKAVDMVGAEKIMWGSDYPSTLKSFTYAQTLDWVRTYCEFLNADQKAAILGGTAEAVAQGLWP
jgi:predicted TIM-barrel fold metal-dependent hydrolase